MQNATTNFWPTARHYAEAVQCPLVCFEEPSLKRMLPAVDRLGMPLVTSGQFAYVFKLNPGDAGGETLAVRCFRGFLGDREERYRALDAHLNANRIASLPRFKYLSKGILVAGRRYPVLVMEWVEGSTLDVYLDEAVGRREALLHLADEWVRLISALREANVAHGDLQHGNIIVEGGRLRLVDLDGMYVPALSGFKASEVGHQHYQHPARDVTHFSADTDNFSALVVYLSLISLAERPELWREHHDENLLFARADFAAPEASALFPKVEAIGGEHARLAGALKAACADGPESAPPLTELVDVPRSSLPGWMNAPANVEVRARTREVVRAPAPREPNWPTPRKWREAPATPASATVQGLFNSQGGQPPAPVAPRDPADLWGNTLHFAKSAFGDSYGYIWWIPLHNFLLRYVWAAFGAEGFASMMLTLVALFVLLLFYGLFRAVYYAETATTALPAGGAPAPGIGPAQPASTLFAAPTPAPPPPPLFAPNAAATPPATVATRPVLGNRSLGIYHLPDCDWAARVPARQRADFDSPASALAAGYRPCRVCKP
ncbi:MAG TPA: Ada metal-binding domain-containing protein [Pyrinomonadaceae bacterium]|nr:Ada metal-binding domain-containing protein [Pyrinomonadaceae bacterium]